MGGDGRAGGLVGEPAREAGGRDVARCSGRWSRAGFATTSYYGADVLFDGSAWWGVASGFWLIASVLLGPPLGVIGAAIGLPGQTGVLAALVVPAGAALQMAVLPPRTASLMAEPVRWSVWIAAAVATMLIARRFLSRSVMASPAGTGRVPLGG